MIDKDMNIEEIIRRFPQTIPVFRRFGIDCVQCQLSEYENLQRGAKVHGIDLQALLADLNDSIRGNG
jgi:hybrid cluster-associated redox disulfide protein